MATDTLLIRTATNRWYYRNRDYVHNGKTSPAANGNSAAGAVTLQDAEREHILAALRQSDWVLGGPNGAAARLDMKRTTLQSKMKKLGIERPR